MAMRRLLFLPALLLLSGSCYGQFSVPARKPIICSGPANNCVWPAVTNGYTGIVIARIMRGQSITIQGQTVQPDYVGAFNGNAIYHFAFTSLPDYPVGVTVTFPENTGYKVFLLLYEGTWTYSKGAQGDYSNANSVFPDCQDGGDCPYWWTQPIVPDPGDLLIAFADANQRDCSAFGPGPGWTMEAVDCNFAVEDKIATVEAPEIGSMYQRALDGSDSGGSHWLMGLAAYSRTAEPK